MVSSAFFFSSKSIPTNQPQNSVYYDGDKTCTFDRHNQEARTANWIDCTFAICNLHTHNNEKNLVFFFCFSCCMRWADSIFNMVKHYILLSYFVTIISAPSVGALLRTVGGAAMAECKDADGKSIRFLNRCDDWIIEKNWCQCRQYATTSCVACTCTVARCRSKIYTHKTKNKKSSI